MQYYIMYYVRNSKLFFIFLLYINTRHNNDKSYDIFFQKNIKVKISEKKISHYKYRLIENNNNYMFSKI